MTSPIRQRQDQLIIGGLQPFTLSDYPGMVAATVFAQGCNFRCPFCHNPTLLPPRPPDGSAGLPLDDLWRWLASRRGMLQALVVSGGEPTIHGDLVAFVAEAKSLGLAVKLDTNGSQPERLERLLAGRLLDYVAMDVKAPLDDVGYARLAGVPVDLEAIRRSIGLIAESGVEHQFRTTVVPALHAIGDPEAIRVALPRRSSYRLQEYRPAGADHVQLPSWGLGAVRR